MKKACFNGIFVNGAKPEIKSSSKIFDKTHIHVNKNIHMDLAEIYIVCSGEGIITLNDIDYPAKGGDVIVADPGVIHEVTQSSDAFIGCYVFSIGNINLNRHEAGHLLADGQRPVVTPNEALFDAIVDCARRTSERFAGNGPDKRGADELLLLLYRAFNKDFYLNDLETATIASRVDRFINEFYNMDITLDIIAEELFLSKYYVLHAYKQETGSTPIKVLTDVRVNAAKELLKDEGMSISQVAVAVGFATSEYFATVFKKNTGVSPREYRRSVTC